MALVTVKPTSVDVAIAGAIARNAEPGVEKAARALTWGADEKILLILAAAGWLGTRGKSEHLRRMGNHALLVTVTTSLLPHALKLFFDQTRPDRRTVVGHVNGISFAGKPKDAFPSGHALHMGALASAAGSLRRASPTNFMMRIQNRRGAPGWDAASGRFHITSVRKTAAAPWPKMKSGRTCALKALIRPATSPVRSQVPAGGAGAGDGHWMTETTRSAPPARTTPLGGIGGPNACDADEKRGRGTHQSSRHYEFLRPIPPWGAHASKATLA